MRSGLAILAVSIATKAVAQGAGFPLFPEGGSQGEMARHCLTVTTADQYAISFGAHVAARMSDGGTWTSWHGTAPAPSEEFLELIGGADAIEGAREAAAALRPYWESLGTTYWAAILRRTSPYQDAEGLALSAAVVRCLDWAETLPFALHHPTARIEYSYPGAPELPSR